MSWVFNGTINQKQTPAFYASSLATRPAAGYVGRLFIDTDTPSTGIYRDTGAAWVAVADPGAGTTGTLQQVTTNGNTTNLGMNIGGACALDNILNIGAPTAGIGYAINAKSATVYGVVVETTSTVLNDNAQILLNSKIGGSISAARSLIFTNSGNLGIGTTTPTQKIDIAGSGVFSGNLAVGTNTPINAGNDGRWFTANGSTYSGGFIAAQNNVTKSIYYYDNVRNNAVIFNPATVGIDLIVNNSGTPALNLSVGNIANFAGRVNVNNATDNASYQLNVTGNGLFSGSVTANSIVKSGGTSSQFLMADGSVTTGGASISGTYSPSYTNGGNTTVIANDPLYSDCYYSRVGNFVMVSGTLLVTPTTSGIITTAVINSLPIASTSTKLFSGVGAFITVGSTNESCDITVYPASNNANITFYATGTTAVRIEYYYTYLTA